jgi:hypothetical protein
MTARRRTSRWSQGVWRAVRRAAEALRALQEEQSRMWDAWCQANEATKSDFAPADLGPDPRRPPAVREPPARSPRHPCRGTP